MGKVVTEKRIIGYRIVGFLKEDGVNLEYGVPSGVETLSKLIEARQTLGDSFVFVQGRDVKVPEYVISITES